jgi:hypothetical protein
MNSLTEWVLQELGPTDSKIEKIIAIFPGRFQPFHKDHHAKFKWLEKQFGTKDTFIVTSDTVKIPKSPFNFNEKKKIINSYGVKNVVQIKNPYKAEELLSKYDPETTAAVFMVGQKDAGRLGGKFFRPWKGEATVGYKEGAYTIIAPELRGSEYSGTQVRQILGSDMDNQEKVKIFKKIFGHTKSNVYDLVTSKLEKISEVMNRFINSVNVPKMLNEVSITATTKTKGGRGGTDVDDGPSYFYGHRQAYETLTKEMAERLGYEVVDWILDDTMDFSNPYPNGPVKSVSYFPAGVAGETTPTNQTDYKGTKAYKEWQKHISRFAQSLGYKFVDWLDSDESIEDTKTEPTTTDKKPNLAESVQGSLLTEGGAFGHVSHPFDEGDMTFGDLKNLIKISLSGELSKETKVMEKMDGQQLSVTWNDGKLKAARNKTELKGFGTNALDTKQIISKFEGRGEITNAFKYAMQDMEKAVKSLSAKKRDAIFQNGKVFLSMEIIWPGTTNVINYDKALLVVHGSQVEYDESGAPVRYINGVASELVQAIKKVNANLQNKFEIIEQPIIDLPKHIDFSKKEPEYLKRLDKIKNVYKLKDTDELIMYHQHWWTDFITKQAEKFGYSLPNNVLVGLTKRWAFSDKGYSVRNMKKEIENEKFLDWAVNYDKKEHKEQLKKNLLPFEQLFFDLGIDILKNLKNFLTASPDKAIQQMRADLDKSIANVKSGGDIKKMNIVSKQLEKIANIQNKILPTEGLIFLFYPKGATEPKTLKLTGSFPVVNQILGILKFSR